MLDAKGYSGYYTLETPYKHYLGISARLRKAFEFAAQAFRVRSANGMIGGMTAVLEAFAVVMRWACLPNS